MNRPLQEPACHSQHPGNSTSATYKHVTYHLRQLTSYLLSSIKRRHFVYPAVPCCHPLPHPALLSFPAGQTLTHHLLVIPTTCCAVQASPAPADPSDGLLYLSNPRLRIGMDPKRGGAITHLSSPVMPPEWADRNLINTWDSGRLIQQSYYGAWLRGNWLSVHCMFVYCSCDSLPVVMVLAF